MSNTANSHWSFRLTRIAGIDVRVHLTFFLLLVWIGLSVWEQTRSQTAVLQGMAFVLTLFACVVLHEFGHALTARRFGIRTRRITLWPIGGVASMERMPDDPKQEILVALAGPAVNVVIAAALWLMLTAADYQPVSVAQDPAALFIDGGAFVYNIMVINVVLAVFNMLPAFPMDGGRVLRASLALAMPHHEATRRAASVGQTLALGLFILGILYNPILVVIAMFIWLGAAGEAGAEQLSHALHSAHARDVMLTRFDTLSGDDTLARAVDLTIHTGQRHFPVDMGNKPPVSLSQDTLLKAVRSHGESDPLRALTLPVMPVVTPETSAETLFRRMQSGEVELIGVVEGDTLSGLVTLNALTRYLQLHRP